MRVYRAEDIEGQIELLRTRQAELTTEICLKLAEISGEKARISDLEERIEASDDARLNFSLLSTQRSVKRSVISLENSITGLRVQCDALDEQIRDFETLFITMPEPGGINPEQWLKDRTRPVAEEEISRAKEQSDDI